MAKLPFNFTIPRRGLAWRGVGYVRQTKTGMVFHKWPKARGAARSEAQQQVQDTFAYATQAIKWMDTNIQQFARELSETTPLLPRDFLMVQLYGRSGYIVMPNGRKIFAVVAMQDVSNVLDHIAQTKGDLLLRGETFWLPLAKGLPNQVLAVSPDGDVEWAVPPAGGAVQLLQTIAITNSATIDVDFNPWLTEFDHLEVQLSNVQPASTAQALKMRMGTGNPPSWVSTSSAYYWGHVYAIGGGATGGFGGLDTFVNLTQATQVHAPPNSGLNGVLKSYNYNQTGAFPRWQYDLDFPDLSNVPIRFAGSAQLQQSHPVTGMRFFFDTGNFNAIGSVKVYGVA